jgi:hypothetical protein
MTSVARNPRLSGLAVAPPEQTSVRRLAWATLITSCGNGAWYTCWALFLTRSVKVPLGAARNARLAGGALALSCVLFALSQGRGGTTVVLILLGAATVHVAGELLFVAACWRLSVDLMPADAPGQYQGVFAT